MGSGIAQVCAQAGFRTIVREVDGNLVQKGLLRIETFLDQGVSRGKLDPESRKSTLANLSGVTTLEELQECDLVIEAITESLDAKRELFSALDPLARPETVFASNTSSLCVTELAAATTRPERFVGLHFFSPVPIMKMVEVVRGLATSNETSDRAMTFVTDLGKEPVCAPDRPGFIVNRLLIPYLLDAIRSYENGLGTLEDIDKSMVLGCGHPMGPFTLLDFIGLDTVYSIAAIMYDEFRDSAFAAPPLLKRMVVSGRLGRKTGRGFYDYA